MKRIDYAIFQLREDMEDNIPIRFANYSSLEKMGVMPTIDRYQEVYRGTLTELEDARSDDTLEKLCLRKIAKSAGICRWRNKRTMENKSGCLTLILGILVGWLIFVGLIWLICLCFGWSFSWSVATGVWLVTILIREVVEAT